MPNSPINRHAAERNQQAGVHDTFPASDPVASTSDRGARAVDLAALQPTPPARKDGQVLDARFPDAAAAKLALEGLVRDGPVDRRCAEITTDADGALLRLRADAGDAERLRGLLQRAAT